MKRISLLICCLAIAFAAAAQTRKVYDEQIDPMQQIDQALTKAKAGGKHLVCQVGGNWCPWCLRLADVVEKDSAINATIQQDYIYIHVNYPRRGAAQRLTERLHNAGRFGYPVLVVMDAEGSVLHIQDSSFLEEGKGYDNAKILRFLKGWTPEAVRTDASKK